MQQRHGPALFTMGWFHKVGSLIGCNMVTFQEVVSKDASVTLGNKGAHEPSELKTGC